MFEGDENGLKRSVSASEAKPFVVLKFGGTSVSFARFRFLKPNILTCFGKYQPRLMCQS